jgi:hypothetical protein
MANECARENLRRQFQRRSEQFHHHHFADGESALPPLKAVAERVTANERIAVHAGAEKYSAYITCRIFGVLSKSGLANYGVSQIPFGLPSTVTLPSGCADFEGDDGQFSLSVESVCFNPYRTYYL